MEPTGRSSGLRDGSTDRRGRRSPIISRVESLARESRSPREILETSDRREPSRPEDERRPAKRRITQLSRHSQDSYEKKEEKKSEQTRIQNYRAHRTVISLSTLRRGCATYDRKRTRSTFTISATPNDSRRRAINKTRANRRKLLFIVRGRTSNFRARANRSAVVEKVFECFFFLFFDSEVPHHRQRDSESTLDARALGRR